MCGIAGCISYDPVPPSRVDEMFKAIQARGREAFGVAYLVDDQWKIMKGQGLYVEPECREFVLRRIEEYQPKVVLCHTRQSTSGTPDRHVNNHPIVGQDMLVIHNGMVYPPTRYQQARGETDTEQMLLHIENRGMFEALPEIDGWMAICLADIQHPKTIRLYTDGGAPLWVGHTPETFTFASVPLARGFYPATVNDLLVVDFQKLRRRHYPVAPKKARKRTPFQWVSRFSPEVLQLPGESRHYREFPKRRK